MSSCDAILQKPCDKLHDCGRVFGLLQSIQPIEDGCQIAQIGGASFVLPSELDLSSFVGQDIGIVCVGEKFLMFYVRRLGA